ncbi:MAG: DUF542 domain-containing protein [Clostridiaceae bacterium]|nr:DUF542 domain-containing protein [Clostridiaceae bacterium]MBW4859499.1 DUF542 domain-containing protein [Clostridiaceae bacterium]MBW4867344.1 DUF542 domain-containing protein [Clostridiaceae bacterium]
MINKDMTISEAIKRHPEIIPTLSDFNIDFCCGGHRSISEALNEKKLDVDSFIKLLNRQENKGEHSIEEAINMNKEDLVQYIIEKYHIPGIPLLDKIDNYMRKLINAHYDTHGSELIEIYGIFMEMKNDLIVHFIKEEKEDFPGFLEGKQVDFDELIEEHENVGDLLKTLEEKTNHYTAPDDGCQTYEYTLKLMKELQDDIHQHIFLENSVLFLK